MSDEYEGAFDLSTENELTGGYRGGFESSGLLMQVLIGLLILIIVLMILKVNKDSQANRICVSTSASDYWPDQVLSRDWKLKNPFSEGAEDRRRALTPNVLSQVLTGQ